VTYFCIVEATCWLVDFQVDGKTSCGTSQLIFDEKPVLKAPANAWKVVPANRAAVLIDAAQYFGALREAMKLAQRSILIVGWDINSRTRLVGESGEADDGLPDALGDFLTALVQAKPQLTVKLLLCDYSIFYSLDREFSPSLSLKWKTPHHIELCLDDSVPIGSAHHQKIVVIDGTIAFFRIGSYDPPLGLQYAHGQQSLSNRSGGRAYAPFHDGDPGDGRGARTRGTGSRPLVRRDIGEAALGNSVGRSMAAVSNARFPVRGRCHIPNHSEGHRQERDSRG
jgi:hypothetical protein